MQKGEKLEEIVVMKEEELQESFERATSEALTAFGNGSGRERIAHKLTI